MAAKRHRGKFDPSNPNPYELSRGRVENFLKCKACFWLEQIKKVKPPEIPSFTINTTTDILLKRDSDFVRGKSSLPIWQEAGLGHMIPYNHEDLEKWTNSLHYGLNESYFNTIHKDTNIKLGGGIDDVFLNTKTDQVHIVDIVDYVPPLGMLGRIMNPVIIKPRILKIFEYRRKKVEELFLKK